MLDLLTPEKTGVKLTPEKSGESKTSAHTPAPQKRVLPDCMDFDWLDNDTVLIEEQRAIAVYENESGGVVIRQHQWPEDDCIVVISPDSLQRIIDRLCDLAGIGGVGGP